VTRAVLAAFTALTLATAAQASPVVHDNIVRFHSIAFTQGKQGSGDSVLPERSNISNVFDAAGPTTFLSLGLGGTLELVISPTSNRIISGFTVERTNLPFDSSNNNHEEAVEVYLGVDGGGFVLLGELRNSHPLAAGVTNASAFATLVFDGAAGPDNEARSLFSFTIIAGVFNSLRFVDISPNNARTNDGFDIAELRLISDGPGTTLVPVPMALSLFGLGLAGLVALRRRR
jgi:hypothetical protein